MLIRRRASADTPRRGGFPPASIPFAAAQAHHLGSARSARCGRRGRGRPVSGTPASTLPRREYGRLGGVRILVAALGSPGHTFPLVPFALALRDGGHEVTCATGPEVRAAVGSTGLPVIEAGGRLASAFGEARVRRGWTGRPADDEQRFTLAAEVFGDLLPRRVLTDLRPWVEQHHIDLVVCETGNPGAALVAASHDIPVVLHSFGRRIPAALPMSGRVTETLKELGNRIGVSGLVVGTALGEMYLDICPSSLQAPPETGAMPGPPERTLRPVAWNPAVTIRPWPKPPQGPRGRRWVYLTLGTAMGDARVLRRAVQGLRRLEVDVLVATGSVAAGELADLDGDAVRVESFVPQADLLASDPAPVLVVHHGGSGTTLATAAAGVPQLFLPQGADQFLNAEAVTTRGAGRMLSPAATQDPEALVDAARALLADGSPHQDAARALAAEIVAMPPPEEVAADLTGQAARSCSIVP